IDGADGGSFEAYTMLASDYPDGKYYIATAFYSAYDFGDFGGQDLSFNLDYNQIGIQAGGFEYPDAMNTVLNIDNTLYLAEVVKSGTTWTVSEFEGFKAEDLNFASSSWGGTDGSLSSSYDWRFPSAVVTAGTSGAYTIDKLNVDWMENIWGETVTSTTPVDIVINDDGTLEIPDQYYMTTDYAGDPYDYNISGTGTWNRYMTPVSMEIHYEMDQDGFLVANWLLNNGYSDYPYFIAEIVVSAKSSDYYPVGHIDGKPY
ncbi:MAG: hypothetical protein GXO50_06365, partial [Chlorobi bacterium]|nr:hypothetical protein [Chlorobiota bacterium]